MFKKVIGVFALAGMLSALSSCTDEKGLYDASSGELVEVTFTVSSEGVLSTRAEGNVHYPQKGEFPQISDGSKAHKLIYAVYDAEGNLLPAFGAEKAEQGIVGYGQVVENVTTFPHTITLTLVRGQQYSIAFWAQNEDCKAFNTDNLRAVSINYKGENGETDLFKCNDEMRDAFCKVETFTVSSAVNQTREIILTRPFAQINLGIPKIEYDAMVKSGVRIAKSKIHIENVATTFDVVNNSTAGEDATKRQAIDFDYDYIPAYENYGVTDEADNIPNDETLANDLTQNVGKEQFLRVDRNRDGEINKYGFITEENPEDEDNLDETFKYLMMCYILPADRTDGTSTYSTTLDKVEIDLLPESEGQAEINIALENVPVQRNWRTNIFGRLFTSDVKLQIDLDPMYSGDYNYPTWERIYEGVTYDPINQCILISNGIGLKWLADATNGTWKTKDEYTFEDHPEYSADLFLKAVGLVEKGWPEGGYFHFDGITIKLQSDIDLSKLADITGDPNDEYFTPIGFGGTDEQNNNMWTGKFFNGIFEGGNHTISNLKTVRPKDNTDDRSFGLFSTGGHTVKIRDLRLKNVDIEGHYRTGGIIGNIYAQITASWGPDKAEVSNCYVDGGIIVSTSRLDGTRYDDANNVGGIVGQFYNEGDITNCFVRNVTIRAYRAVGGILGQSGGDSPNLNLVGNKVFDVVLIADQFQEYRTDKDYAIEIENPFIACDGSYKYYPNNGRRDKYDGKICSSETMIGFDFGSNISNNVKIYAFGHKTLTEKDDNYDYVKGQDGKRFTEIGQSDLCSNPPLDIFPRLVKYTDYVHFSSSILGGPSAYKKYNGDADYKGTANKSSGRVGLWVSGVTIDGDTDGNPATIDNHTITVSNVDGDKDCAMYVVGGATIKNLTVHGATYANEGICLSPESGKTITLDNVLSYDATTVLTDEGNGNDAILSVTNSNFRGNVKYSGGYKDNVTFTNTTFGRSTKKENENTLTVSNNTTFSNCVFKAPYTIEIANDVTATFDSNCKAVVNGVEIEVAMPTSKTGGSIVIKINDKGEPVVE
ncbi:MAG: hypothetical protein J1F40_05515 [Prevotellaceae bacterium]|nr:hypothetical protein [Prevotellaceae bacterium]